MTAPKVFAPYLTVLGCPVMGSLKNISRVGHVVRKKTSVFDGVEIHLAGTRKFLASYSMAQAERLKLRFTQHEGWWWNADGTKNPTNRALAVAGLLPQRGYLLADHLLATGGNTGWLWAPAVVYANKIHEAVWQKSRLQTYSTRHPDGRFEMPYNEFLKVFDRNPKEIVWDPQHLLTWKLNLPGPDGISGIPTDENIVRRHLDEAWERFGSHVTEIHGVTWIPGTSIRNASYDLGMRAPLDHIRKILRGNAKVVTVVPEVALPFFRTTYEQLEEVRQNVLRYLDV